MDTTCIIQDSVCKQKIIILGIDDIGFEELHKKLDKLQQMVHDFQRLLQEEETINLTCAHLLYHFGLVRSLTNLIRRPGRDYSNDKLLEINSLDPVSLLSTQRTMIIFLRLFVRKTTPGGPDISNSRKSHSKCFIMSSTGSKKV